MHKSTKQLFVKDNKAYYFCSMSMPIKPVTIELHNDIRKDYEKMSAPHPEFGVQEKTDAFIFRSLAKKYYKSWKTVEKIIYNRI